MKARLLVALAVALASCPPVPAEPLLGGEVNLRSGALIRLGAEPPLSIEWHGRLEPLLLVDASSFSLSTRLSVDTGAGGAATIGVEQLELTVYPADWLRLRAGRFVHAPGFAAFASPLGYLSRIDVERLVAGDTGGAEWGTDLLELTAYLGSFHIAAAFTPVAPPPLVPSPDSPWFPRAGIPTSITLPIPSEHTLTLGELTLDSSAAGAAGDFRPSVCAEVGLSLSSLALLATYFHGVDTSVLLEAEMSFPTGLYGSYDVTLRPVDRLIDAFGLAASVSRGPLVSWLEASVTVRELLVSDLLSPGTFRTSLVAAPFLRAVAGASYAPERPRVTLLAEYHGAWVLSPGLMVRLPLLSNLAVASASVRLLSGRLVPSLLLLESLADWSGALYVRLSLAFTDELRLTLSVPTFYGPADGELGQYRGNHLVTVVLTGGF